MMGKTSVELLIFDLDGTLIESKWDIAASVNLTLAELGLPQRSEEEIFGFVGDGVKQLLRLSVGESIAGVQGPVLGPLPRSYDVLSRHRRGAHAFRR
jgi:phosphoglycolate phosphatase-like HAD superfamily hydrolase